MEAGNKMSFPRGGGGTGDGDATIDVMRLGAELLEHLGGCVRGSGFTQDSIFQGYLCISGDNDGLSLWRCGRKK
jgi:hypothetical protein